MSEGKQLVFLSSETEEILLSRSYGGFMDHPLTVIGPLNAAQVFASQHGSEVVRATCGQLNVFWRQFEDKIKVILIVSGGAPHPGNMSTVIEYAFNSLVLLAGIAKVTMTTNTEGWRRSTEVALPLLDQLMNDDAGLFTHHTATLDVVLPKENVRIVTECLDVFARMAQTAFGCVLINGLVYAATQSWFNLEPLESGLLSHLVLSQIASFTTCADIPVFLPVTNKHVVHRLVVFNLFSNCAVCLLLGSDALISLLLPQVKRHWEIVAGQLKAEQGGQDLTKSCSQDGFEGCWDCVHVALGKKRRCTHFSSSKGMLKENAGHNLTLKRQMVDFLLKMIHRSSETSNKIESSQHPLKEAYSCYKSHNCYAICSEDTILVAVFPPKTSAPAMRSICQRIKGTALAFLD